MKWRKNPERTWNMDDLKASVLEEFSDLEFTDEILSWWDGRPGGRDGGCNDDGHVGTGSKDPPSRSTFTAGGDVVTIRSILDIRSRIDAIRSIGIDDPEDAHRQADALYFDAMKALSVGRLVGNHAAFAAEVLKVEEVKFPRRCA